MWVHRIELNDLFIMFGKRNRSSIIEKKMILLRSLKQDAMVKDTLERATEPNLNLRTYLQDAYIHPVFKDGAFETLATDEEENNVLVPTKRTSQRSTPAQSKYDSEASDTGGA